MKEFGSTAYAHVPKQFRDKFVEKFKKCLIIRYTNTEDRWWNQGEKKIMESRDVIF